MTKFCCLLIIFANNLKQNDALKVLESYKNFLKKLILQKLSRMLDSIYHTTLIK